MELTTTKVTTLVLDKKTAQSLLESLKTFINEEEDDLIFLASGFVGDKNPVLLEIYLDSNSPLEEDDEDLESVITD